MISFNTKPLKSCEVFSVPRSSLLIQIRTSRVPFWESGEGTRKSTGDTGCVGRVTGYTERSMAADDLKGELVTSFTAPGCCPVQRRNWNSFTLTCQPYLVLCNRPLQLKISDKFFKTPFGRPLVYPLIPLITALVLCLQ